jgi:hypothetical protein
VLGYSHHEQQECNDQQATINCENAIAPTIIFSSLQEAIAIPLKNKYSQTI